MFTIYVGLPGSGKTAQAVAEATRTAGAMIFTDFLRPDRLDDPARGMSGLEACIAAGVAVFACDARLCLSAERTRLVQRLAARGIGRNAGRWIYFANDPAACRANVERRLDLKSRGGEPTIADALARHDDALRLIDCLSGGYAVPPGAEAMGVVRVAGWAPGACPPE